MNRAATGSPSRTQSLSARWRRVVSLLSAALLACAPGAVHADPLDDAIALLAEGVPYADARGTLIAAGWQPLAFDMSTISGRCSFREEVCTAYPEAESCSGTGMGYCLFRFASDGGRDLSVTTAGEELDMLVVVGWTQE